MIHTTFTEKDLLPYINEGYDKEQLWYIQKALKKNLPVQPYLDPFYCGSSIHEIALGLEHHVDVNVYADKRYTWRKMKELRLGLEQHLDISQYQNPLYSYWQMREIRLGLKEGLNVSYYSSLMFTAQEMHKRRLQLKEQSRNLSSEKILTYIDNDYHLKVTPDGMSAYLCWHSNRPIQNRDELLDILQKNHIVHGIDMQALDTLVRAHQSTDRNSYILVAHGTNAIPGHDSSHELFFQTRKCRMPKIHKDHTIDFSNLSLFEMVKKGDILAVYHPSTPSVDGMTITGTPIHATSGKEKSHFTGEGFLVTEDKKTYIAEKDGCVRLHKHKLTVSDLVILEELSSCEAMSFDCDVYVKGNITGPCTIKVKGSLQVDGLVDSANIYCSGNLLLKGGVHATDGYHELRAGKNIICKFFEYATAHADGNIYFGSSLNSNLSSYGEIIGYGKKGGIIGGTSYAEKGYCLPNIGNPAGTSTTLFLGTNENIDLQQFELKKALLNAGSSLEELDKLRKKIELLQKRIHRACESRIIVEQELHDNVNVHYLNHKITPIPSSQVSIRIRDNHLVMEKF